MPNVIDLEKDKDGVYIQKKVQKKMQQKQRAIQHNIKKDDLIEVFVKGVERGSNIINRLKRVLK